MEMCKSFALVSRIFFEFHHVLDSSITTKSVNWDGEKGVALSVKTIAERTAHHAKVLHSLILIVSF
jgi:mannitol/fructose-specific phosphotransferase system IIA component